MPLFPTVSLKELGCWCLCACWRVLGKYRAASPGYLYSARGFLTTAKQLSEVFQGASHKEKGFG